MTCYTKGNNKWHDTVSLTRNHGGQMTAKKKSWQEKKKSVPILGRKKIFKFSECKNGWKVSFPSQISIQKYICLYTHLLLLWEQNCRFCSTQKVFWNDTNLSLSVSRIITLVFTEVVGFPTRGIRLGRSTLPGEHLRKC